MLNSDIFKSWICITLNIQFIYNAWCCISILCIRPNFILADTLAYVYVIYHSYFLLTVLFSHLDKCVYVSNSACLALNFIICDTKMSYSHSEMLMNFSTISHLKKRKITNFFIWLSKTILINFKTEFSWSLTFLAVYLYVYIPIHT